MTTRQMTPFEAFLDIAAERTPTEPCEPPKASEAPPSISDLSAAVARLESAFEKESKMVQDAIESRTKETKMAVAQFLETVLARDQVYKIELDEHAKAIRALNAEAREARAARGLPPSEALVDL